MFRAVSLASLNGSRALRARATRGASFASTAAMLASAACGDPLVTEPSRGDPLFSVQGTVTQGVLDAAPVVSQEVGVLWLNHVDDNQAVLVEATPADVIGNELPSGFDVSVLAAPSDRMLGTTLISYGQDGSSAQPIDRNRVAFGVVVVAAEGTFARLPTEASLGEFISPSDAAPGPLLRQFTYVSPFTVRYVKDAGLDSVVIRDVNGVESVLQDFTVFDISAWARAVDTAACQDRRLGEGWQAPEVQSCIVNANLANEANKEAYPACLEACGTVGEESTTEELQAYEACALACPAERTSQDIENTCLYEYADSRAVETDEICGILPEPAVSDFRNSRRLEEGEEVLLPLGGGDVRNALTVGGFTFLG